MTIKDYLYIAAIAVLAAALFWFGFHERSVEHAKDVAATHAAVEKQIAANVADAAKREAENKEIVNGLKTQLLDAGVGTQLVVRRLCELPRGSPVPASPVGPKPADGAPAVTPGGEAPAPTIADEYVAACRTDSDRLAGWQQWALKQGLPIEP